MAFSDEIEKPSSKRFVLARLEPGRYINDNLVLQSTFLYSASFPNLVVSKVERNGIALTRVFDEPDSDGEWFYDEDTGEFLVYTDTPSANRVFILYYYLFYTTDYDKVYPQDVTSGVERSWVGRISNSPGSQQSINNLVSAFLLTSSTSELVISNTDYDFQQYITDNDSFSNSRVDIWYVINNEIQKIFTGQAISFSIDKDSISISLNDSFNLLLNKAATFGEDFDETYLSDDAYPDAFSEHINLPIPVIFGRTSQYNWNKNIISEKTLNFGLIKEKTNNTAVHPTFGNRYITGKEYVLCRIPDSVSLKTPNPTGGSFPRVVNFAEVVDGGGNDVGWYNYLSTDGLLYSGDQTNEIEAGDALSITTAGGNANFPAGTWHAVVLGINYDGTNTYVKLAVQGLITGVIGTGVTVNSVTWKARPNLVLQVAAESSDNTATEQAKSLAQNLEPDDHWILIPDYHFTTTVTNQTNTKLITVDINTIWPLQRSRMLTTTAQWQQYWFPTNPLTLDYNSDAKLLWKIKTDNAIGNHSDTLKWMLEKTGLATDSATFATAKTGFNADVLFQIPFVGEQTLEPLATYLEPFLKSCLSAIYLNEDNEILYKLLELPQAGGSSYNENNFLKNSLNVSVNFRDIITSLLFKNKHAPTFTTFNSATSFYAYENAKTKYRSKKAKYLYNIDRIEEFEHILEDIKIDNRYQKLLGLLAARVVNYSFNLSPEGFLKNISDNIVIDDEIVLGNDSFKNLRITEVNKDINEISIIASDLLGL